jgi:hypothetical protein
MPVSFQLLKKSPEVGLARGTGRGRGRHRNGPMADLIWKYVLKDSTLILKRQQGVQ